MCGDVSHGKLCRRDPGACMREETFNLQLWSRYPTGQTDFFKVALKPNLISIKSYSAQGIALTL